jgi:hypothetical protein
MKELTERIAVLEQKVKTLEETRVLKSECEKGKTNTKHAAINAVDGNVKLL